MRVTASVATGNGAFGALSADFNTAKMSDPGVIEATLATTPSLPRILAVDAARVTRPLASEMIEPLTPVTSPLTVVPAMGEPPRASGVVMTARVRDWAKRLVVLRRATARIFRNIIAHSTAP